MRSITEILYEICEDEAVLDPDCELIESGILDSLAFIELFSALEDEGIFLQPTRIDRTMLKTPRTIERLIEETAENEA
ncbi:MAG: D-alanine--poly(phosphoribitol) ligase subunit 2 [Ruminococcaceae bacterium]|nr:D-alanine--poly(phosphoribitol) ligase subunit 2 [Oscillospiraceae bacterium]